MNWYTKYKTRKVASPYVPFKGSIVFPCCGRNVGKVDIHVEDFGTHQVSEHYEDSVENFFGTKDKKEIVKDIMKDAHVPVYCDLCDKVWMIDKFNGEVIQPLAKTWKGLEKQSLLMKKSWKFVAEKTFECGHCQTKLVVKDVTFNPNHFFNPGQLYKCSCQKSQIWANSVRYPEALISYCDGEEVMSSQNPEAWGFCNDQFCPYCNGIFLPLENGYIYKGDFTDRYGCRICQQNQHVILVNEKLGELEGQKYLAMWYKENQQMWRQKVEQWINQ